MRRDRYLKFDLMTSVGSINGSISVGHLLARSGHGNIHGVWRSEEDLRGLLSQLGLRQDETRDIARDLLHRWELHEQARRDRNRG